MPATLNSSPRFPNPFGNVFGYLASQWAQLFAQKVDIESGIADNLTVTGTLTLAGFQTAPLTGAAPPLLLAGGTMSLRYDTSLFQLSGTNALTLQTNGVTNGLLAQMPGDTLKGNAVGGSANPADLTATQVTALLNQFTALLQGLVPASGGGATNFLRADGTWSVPTSTSVPSGAVTAYAGSSAPTGWLACDGSAVSRTTYAALFAAIGTSYGAGDGSTTFNVPDGRGRTVAGFDSGNATGRLTGSPTGGVSAAALGNAGGEQGHVLATAELAVHAHGVSDPGHTHNHSDPGHTHNHSDPGHAHNITDPQHNHVEGQLATLNVNNGGGQGYTTYATSGTANPVTNSAATGIGIVSNTTGLTNLSNTTGLTNVSNTTGISTQNAGSGSSHNTVQPTLIVNWIIKT